MKVSELRNKDISELNKELFSLLKAQIGIRMQLATQQLSNPKQLTAIKKDIARVKTIITQKINNHDK